MAETSNIAIGPVKGKTYYEIQQEQAELDNDSDFTQA